MLRRLNRRLLRARKVGRKRALAARKRGWGARRQAARRLTRFRRANRAFPWLLALDLLGWRDTPRDRVINTLRAAHSDKQGAYALDRVFARRRPAVREADKLAVK